MSARPAYKPIRPRILCADGASLSVQASRTHYSEPREDAGPYTHVEVGFPSHKPSDAWRAYYDGPEESFDAEWGGSVYAYVPVALVEEYIKEHGGLDTAWATAWVVQS